MTHAIDLIVFDLDGTLVDSLPDLAVAANHALRSLGLPEHPVEVHQKMIGGGEKNYVRRLLGSEHQHLFPQALKLYLAHYSGHLGDRTRVYPGVAATLVRLSPRKMAVLSNKREDLCRGVVEAMGLAGFFQAVRGGDSYGVLKPSSGGLGALIRELREEPTRTLMVGDKPEDILTGRGAGVYTAAVTYGYGEVSTINAAQPDNLLTTFPQVADLLAS
ncbi:MAG: HAD hydrolase-like protein [Syntrophobacterales bacterium]|jgi:phosphoglycolate phosphatase